jgi:hypothetical protein
MLLDKGRLSTNAMYRVLSRFLTESVILEENRVDSEFWELRDEASCNTHRPDASSVVVPTNPQFAVGRELAHKRDKIPFMALSQWMNDDRV